MVIPTWIVLLATLVLGACVLATLIVHARRNHRDLKTAKQQLLGLHDELAASRESIAAQAQQFAQIERMAKMGSWTSDLATNTIRASDAYLAIYERPLAEIPATADEFVERFVDAGAQRQEALANLAKIEAGEAIEAVRRIRVGEDRYKWIAFRNEPRLDTDGKRIGNRGIVRDITEERANAEQINEAAALLEEYNRIAGIAHFYWDLPTGRLDASPECLQLFDIPEGDTVATMEEWVGRCSDPDDAEDIATNLRAVARCEPYRVTRRCRVAGGSLRYVEISGAPIVGDDGAAIAYRGIARDVTERHNDLARAVESEARLRASEENLVRAQRLARIGSWRLDMATGRMEYSDEYLNLFELTPEDAPRTPSEWIARFVPDTDKAEAVKTIFEQALQDARSYSGIRSIILKDGSTRWLSFAADPVVAPDGSVVAIVGATRDITFEHMARTSLQASEERFRMISENMQDIVTLHDAEGRVLYATPSLSRVLGHHPSDNAYNSPFLYVHPDDASAVKASVARILAGDAPIEKLELQLRKRGGEYAWVEASFVRVLNEDGSLRHIQAITRDVSERKRAEADLAERTAELANTNRLLVEEAARRQALERRVMLSIEGALSQVGLELHDDLGQQLTGISLLVKTMESKLTSSPPQHERSTAREAARIAELVNRAINHTRMISHGLSPYMVGDLGLTSALAQLANDIDGLGVIACVAEIDPRIRIHDEVASRSLFRIAQEATNNALKHSGAGLVRISLKLAGRDLQLTIADDGSGVDSPATSRKSLGVLSTGLHSIKHRVQLIGARMKIRPSGKGMTVIVRWQYPADSVASIKPPQRRLVSVGKSS